MLAACSSLHRAEARADFRRYYGLDFDDVSVARPLYAADLAAMLPAWSRTAAAMHPGEAPADPSALLTAIELELRCIVAGMSGDGGEQRPMVSGAAGAEPFDEGRMRMVAEALGVEL